NPNPNPENLSTKGKAKARTAKPANENAVTTGFGVELSDSERKRPIPVPSTSLCEPFREAIELGIFLMVAAFAVSGIRGGLAFQVAVPAHAEGWTNSDVLRYSAVLRSAGDLRMGYVRF